MITAPVMGAVTVRSFAVRHIRAMPLALRSVHGLALAAVLFAATPSSAQNTTAPDAAKEAETKTPSFTALFTKLPADLRRLPTRANALWLDGAGALALAVHPGDQSVTHHASGSLGLEEALDSGELLGDGLVQAGGALGTYLVGRFTHRPDVAIVGADLVRAQIIGAGITQGIKSRDEPPTAGRQSVLVSVRALGFQLCHCRSARTTFRLESEAASIRTVVVRCGVATV
jgi:hypothetical protein